MRRLPVLFLLALVLALVAACGGGDDDGGEPLSLAEYRKQANASCVAAEKKLALLGGFEDFEELEREMLVGQDALEQSAEELAGLVPPAAVAARHQEFVNLTEQTAELAGLMATAAGENDQVQMQKQAERADELTVSANEVARKLGALECVAG
jgi:hypothetical protein